jgi:DNA polymerase-3 subunit alpha
VQKFAGYGFNKSHAAAYAYIAYQTAYLKANHAAAFLAASMSLDKANTDKLAVFLQEAQRSGVAVLPPHVNHSEAEFSVNQDGAIVYALSAVKNVGEGAMSAVAAERRRGGPFRDIYDFAERVDLKVIGKRALENLARAGAFDGLCKSRAEALAAVEMLVRYSAQAIEERSSQQAGLFELDAAPQLDRPRLPEAEEWPPLDRLNEERAALGFYFSGHPLDDYERELRRLNAVTCAELNARAANERVGAQIAAVVRSVRMRRSRAGKPFAWVECSDTTGEFEITVFSEVLNSSRDLLEPGSLVLLSVTAEDRDGEIRFTCEAVRRLDTAAAQAMSMLKVAVSTPEALEAVSRRLAAVRPASRQEEGRVVLSLRLGESGREVELSLARPAAATPALRGALKSVDGVADVELI